MPNPRPECGTSAWRQWVGMAVCAVPWFVGWGETCIRSAAGNVAGNILMTLFILQITEARFPCVRRDCPVISLTPPRVSYIEMPCAKEHIMKPVLDLGMVGWGSNPRALQFRALPHKRPPHLGPPTSRGSTSGPLLTLRGHFRKPFMIWPLASRYRHFKFAKAMDMTLVVGGPGSFSHWGPIECMPQGPQQGKSVPAYRHGTSIHRVKIFLIHFL